MYYVLYKEDFVFFKRALRIILITIGRRFTHRLLDKKKKGQILHIRKLYAEYFY